MTERLSLAEFPPVLNAEQVCAYLHCGREKLRDYMQRRHNPLPHVRSSDYDSDHATLLFRRNWVDAWLDREHQRQHGWPAVEEDDLRRVG